MKAQTFATLTGTQEDIAKATIIRERVMRQLPKQIKQARSLAAVMMTPDQIVAIEMQIADLLPGLARKTDAAWWVANDRQLVKLSFTKITA